MTSENEFNLPASLTGGMSASQLAALEEPEDNTPIGFQALYREDKTDLTKITETPKRMVLPLVRFRIINRSYDPTRKTSLLEEFVQEFDRRMISMDRKGRLEAVRLIQGLNRNSEEDIDEVQI